MLTKGVDDIKRTRIHKHTRTHAHIHTCRKRTLTILQQRCLFNLCEKPAFNGNVLCSTKIVRHVRWTMIFAFASVARFLQPWQTHYPKQGTCNRQILMVNVLRVLTTHAYVCGRKAPVCALRGETVVPQPLEGALAAVSGGAGPWATRSHSTLWESRHNGGAHPGPQTASCTP